MSPDGVRRRRVCTQCKRRFTTYEKLGSPGLKVEKRDGRVELFDGDKLLAALRRICGHRPAIKDEHLRRIARDLEANLIDGGTKTVRWSDIVTLTLRRLEGVDVVVARRLAANYLDETGQLRLETPPKSPVPPQLDLPGVDEALIDEPE